MEELFTINDYQDAFITIRVSKYIHFFKRVVVGENGSVS